MTRATQIGATFLFIAVFASLCLFWIKIRESAPLKPIAELRIRIAGATNIPDPARINSAGDWYYLDHISSGLAFYDNDKKIFQPLFAESWEYAPDGSHRFRLASGARFNDGTPITVKDVLWTLKRQIILNTSTHFKLSEYVTGCDRIRSLDDECLGLTAASDREIVIKLKIHTESFFLQLASPETGIWSAADMDPKTLALRPTRFSGPYAVESVNDDAAVLKRNEYSPISTRFPNSPRRIRIKKIALSEVDNALIKGDVDLVVRQHKALPEVDLRQHGLQIRSTTASGIIYLSGLTGGSSTRPAIGQDFIQKKSVESLDFERRADTVYAALS
jgi:ABC-type transport system substrate-binding protein